MKKILKTGIKWVSVPSWGAMFVIVAVLIIPGVANALNADVLLIKLKNIKGITGVYTVIVMLVGYKIMVFVGTILTRILDLRSPNRALNRAIKFVELTETSKAYFYFTEAESLVLALPDGAQKAALQDRLDSFRSTIYTPNI